MGKLRGTNFNSLEEAIEHYTKLYTEELEKLDYKFIRFEDGKFRLCKAKCYVYCSTCAKDPEMFGDGVFSCGNIYLIKEGQKCCGCSKAPRYTESQYRVIVERCLKETEIKVISLDLKPIGAKKTVTINCHKHGDVVANLKNLIFRGVHCKFCSFEKSSEKLKGVAPWAAINKLSKTDDQFIEKFLKHDVFHPDTVFTKLNVDKWYMECPECGWEGETWESSLARGILPCKCSKAPRWKVAEREDLLREISKDRLYKFDSWYEDFRGIHTKINARCEIHGTWPISTDNFIRGRGCPSCVGKNQTQAYINIIYDSEVPIALKFGIARDADERIKGQIRNCIYKLENYGTWVFDDFIQCKNVERIVKTEVDCGIVPRTEMADGYTETTYIYNLEKIVAIYEENGGVRK